MSFFAVFSTTSTVVILVCRSSLIRHHSHRNYVVIRIRSDGYVTHSRLVTAVKVEQDEITARADLLLTRITEDSQQLQNHCHLFPVLHYSASSSTCRTRDNISRLRMRAYWRLHCMSQHQCLYIPPVAR